MRPFLPLLLALFVGSGCAALIYEVVWFQLLQLAIGSSAVSLGVLLATYMGGMCLGSLLFPRYVSSKVHPLKAYAAIEAAIGVYALSLLFLIPFLDRIYAAVAGLGFPGIAPRAALAVLALLPPTLLMGASLPAIARWVTSTPEGVSWMGYFYGGNIVGAVGGCVLAGFYLLRLYDMAVATYAGVVIDFAVALAGFALALRTDYAGSGQKEDAAIAGGAPKVVYVTIAISGLAAMGAEVVWTRALATTIGATVYTFSIILAVFLTGLGIGSAAGSVLTKTGKVRDALGYCQLLAGASVAWGAYAIAVILPAWKVNTLATPTAWATFQVDLMRCVWVLLPAACFWGASFPLAVGSAAQDEQDPARLIGGVYAANTVGAILGAAGFSLVLLPWLGTQNSQRALVLACALSAALVLWNNRPMRVAILAVGCAAMAALAFTVQEVPWIHAAYGRRAQSVTGAGQPLYREEGRNATVIVSQLDEGQIYFHVSGKVEASTEPYDMRLQRMMGHLPALLHPGPHSALVVGFGAGVTAGSFVVHPEMQRLVICEIEKLIPPATTLYFGPQNYNVLHDPRTQVVYDDARHFVLTTNEKFDVITSDPIHPWVKGTATLYSREYFELCKRHLNPGGVVAQWIPLYESDPDTIKSELATFFEVFPNGTLWANNIGEDGYDAVVVGQVEPLKIDVDQLQARLDRPDHARVAASIRQVQFDSAIDLMGTYLARPADLAPWLKDAQVNRDINLRLQYLAGMGLNYNNAPAIAQQISSFKRFPSDLFVGSPDRIAAISQLLLR